MVSPLTPCSVYWPILLSLALLVMTEQCLAATTRLAHTGVRQGESSHFTDTPKGSRQRSATDMQSAQPLDMGLGNVRSPSKGWDQEGVDSQAAVHGMAGFNSLSKELDSQESKWRKEEYERSSTDEVPNVQQEEDSGGSRGRTSKRDRVRQTEQPFPDLSEDEACSLVCQFCRTVLSMRWAALCHVQCQSGGRAYDACVTVWSFKQDLGNQ